MQKFKVSLSVPSTVVDGLDDLHALHPALGKAEQALADAKQELEARRNRVAELAATITELPDRIVARTVTENQLAKTVNDKAAAELLVTAAARVVERAQKELTQEQGRAYKAQQAEIAHRREQLAKLAQEVMPAVKALRNLELELAAAEYRATSTHGVATRRLCIKWPATLRHGMLTEDPDPPAPVKEPAQRKAG